MNMEPFLGYRGVAAGLFTRRKLLRESQRDDPPERLPTEGREAHCRDAGDGCLAVVRTRATAAGLSAAALHGSKWIDAALPAELIRPAACEVKGIVVRRDCLVETETCVVRGVAATTPRADRLRPGRRRGTLSKRSIRLDALANATELKPEERRGPLVASPRRPRVAAIAGRDRPDGRRRGVPAGDADAPASHRGRISAARDADRGVRRLRAVRWPCRSGISEVEGRDRVRRSTGHPAEGQGDIGMVPKRTLATSRGSPTSKRKGGSSFGSPVTSFDTGGAPSSPGFGMRCATEDGLTTRQSG